MAEKQPQDQLRELKELVIAYFKQETIDPLKGLVRYVAFGVLGAVLMGTGICFLAIGGLRALQTQTGTTFTGNWSWAPYGLTILGPVDHRLRRAVEGAQPEELRVSRNDTKSLANGHGTTQRGPITRADLEAKLRDITGDVGDTVEAARGIGVAVAVGAGVVLVVAAYWMGRRKGRKRKTVLEIRRI